MVVFCLLHCRHFLDNAHQDKKVYLKKKTLLSEQREDENNTHQNTTSFLLPFTEWVWSQVRQETKKWQIHFGVNLGKREAFYLIKAYKARKLQVQERIIPAKVRIHPPEPQAKIEWQGNGWTLKSGIYGGLQFLGRALGISFTYYFHCYNKWHEYPNQITRRRHPATETKQQNIEKLLNVFVCSKRFFEYDSDNTEILCIIDNRSYY